MLHLFLKFVIQCIIHYFASTEFKIQSASKEFGMDVHVPIQHQSILININVYCSIHEEKNSV